MAVYGSPEYYAERGEDDPWISKSSRLTGAANAGLNPGAAYDPNSTASYAQQMQAARAGTQINPADYGPQTGAWTGQNPTGHYQNMDAYNAIMSGNPLPGTVGAPQGPGNDAQAGGPGGVDAANNYNTGGGPVGTKAMGADVPLHQQPANSLGGFQTQGFQYGLGPTGNINMNSMNNAGGYDTNYIGAQRMPVGSVGNSGPYQQQMQEAYYNQAKSRLDPQWQNAQNDMSTQLTNQGITPGSEAYNRQMQSFNQGRNDAYGSAANTAIMNSGQEAARMQGMDINAGNFANQAAQQNYQNRLTSQGAYNQALTGQQGLDLAARGFGNQAQQQGWNQRMGEAQLNNQAWGQNQQLGLQNKSLDQTYSLGLGNQALTGRGLENQERNMDFNQALQMGRYPYELQNLIMQGQYPGSPTFNNNGMPGAPSNPYYNGMQGGYNTSLGGWTGLAQTVGANIPWSQWGGGGGIPDASGVTGNQMTSWWGG
jgi:hypothetical protein